MKPTQALHEAGQSLWLDNITRALLDKGILARYVAEYSVTGLTSNPTIFDRAIKDGTAYDADIAARKANGATDEQVFFDLALADLRRAAELLAPVHEGLPAIEECIYAGVPVNVTLLFSAPGRTGPGGGLGGLAVRIPLGRGGGRGRPGAAAAVGLDLGQGPASP